MTIKETALQKDVVDAVRAAGGAATKLSNRFLIGVCDLLIQLPNDRPAMLMEVKKNTYPVKSQSVKLDVTTLQEKFLCNFAAAGMPAGVMSFLIDGRKLWICAASIADTMGVDYHVPLHNYWEIKLGRRGQAILNVLRLFSNSYEAIKT